MLNLKQFALRIIITQNCSNLLVDLTRGREQIQWVAHPTLQNVENNGHPTTQTV